MKHWAADLIGREYSPDFNCWALVREVVRRRTGFLMPEFDAGIQRLSAGWERCPVPARELDLVVGWDIRKQRHVGIMVAFREGLQMLHNVEGEGVIRQTLAEAKGQLGGIELWRRA